MRNYASHQYDATHSGVENGVGNLFYVKSKLINPLLKSVLYYESTDAGKDCAGVLKSSGLFTIVPHARMVSMDAGPICFSNIFTQDLIPQGPHDLYDCLLNQGV